MYLKRLSSAGSTDKQKRRLAFPTKSEADLRLLVLAGKTIDTSIIDTLFSGYEYVLTQHNNVSRGVRQLERSPADAVMIIPDPNDDTWLRAIERTKIEYQCRSILLASCGEDCETQAINAGAFDVLDFNRLTPARLGNTLRHLKRQLELERALAKENSMFDWVEKAGRLGSWEMDSNGKTTWSKGIKQITGGGKALTDDFSSVRELVHPEDIEIYDQANKATFDQGWPLDFEYRIKVGNDIKYLHLHRRVNHGKDGTVESAYGMTRDVTAEREFENFLFRRDAILQVVSSFAERFLRESDWESGINDSLKALGKAADVTRCFIFKKHPGSDEEANISMAYEWSAPEIVPYINNPLVQNQPFHAYDRWRKTMLSRKNIAGTVSSFQSQERRFFQLTDAKSVMLVPVFVGDTWWGFIGVSEHREEREWLPVEVESLTMMADIFGSAILRRTMEDQLMAANRLAEDAKMEALESSKAKSRFLANMSHEIRTPISGILGMAEMTITTGLSPDQREHLDMIRDAAGSLLTIVNDVLDISKIEAEKLELKPVDFEFRSELDRIMRPFNPEADRKGIALRYNVSPDVPPHLHGDPDRFSQVIRNLAGNAMKFTERGLVEVSVNVAERSEGKVCLKVLVRDTGEGIDLAATDDIFESFTQADSSTRKRHQGTGLGLTISRELVEMMGGEIDVESELGLGSTFTFTVWFNTTEVVERVVDAAPVQPQTMHLNILLAEDNPLNQKFLTHFLTMFGHTVTHAGNGLLALEALKHPGNKFDLVLMDIQMPEMGGIEATRAIREADGKDFSPDIPIIALTAYAMKGDRERMVAAGMNDYVSKPVDMKKLSAAIARGMAESKQSTKPKVAPKTSQVARDRIAAASKPMDIDMESLIDRFEGDMELLTEILNLFLLEAEDKLDNLDAGLRSGEADELGMALHSITNIASHVLAMEIVESSRELERRCYLEDVQHVRSGIMELRPKFVALIHAVRARAKTL